ncbi:hypothetical protein [Agrobacterium tumefaciens]|uniref:hypothetical protein n=1 Tax=Agrobacterium tumefaciens TaxID=358 RepID=UPI000459BC79|nr:hypothetical protein [Agrobacterium tumefaciens]CDN96479.1 Response regulator containing a CheY-like receiver domain and an HTH DNA-binding domain protein [Agrobacterium tumefaciens]
MTFSAISRTLLDNWIGASNPEPSALYEGIVSQMSVRMRLAVIDVSAPNNGDWLLNPIKQTRLTSRIINLNALFKAGRLGDFKDQDYLRNAVFPQYQSVIETRQPLIDMVETRLAGVKVTYERIILPQKSERPSWLLTCTNGRFMASAPSQKLRLDNVDQTIMLHLIVGETKRWFGLSEQFRAFC